MADGDFEVVDSINENGISEVVISGNLTLDNADSLHSHFTNNCIKPDVLVLTIEKVESIDISTIQLITALLSNRKLNKKKTETRLNLDSTTNDLLLNTGVIYLIESITKSKT